MNKFEYKIIKEVKDYCLEEELNKFGQEGWGCFELKRDSNGVTVYLKRLVIETGVKFVSTHIDKFEDPWLKSCVEEWSKGNHTVSNCADYLKEFYTEQANISTTDKLKAFEIIKRIILDDSTYFDVNYGCGENKLYIDGCASYQNEAEKALIQSVFAKAVENTNLLKNESYRLKNK